MDWDKLNLNTLERLRKTFLAGEADVGNYWRKWDDLEQYDFIFARRIGWKWDAVLGELKRLGWQPPSGVMLDWGCGTGMASRCVLQHFGAAKFREVRVHDQSKLAERFAIGAVKQETGRLKVSAANSDTLASRKPLGLLLLSHVLNELPPEQIANVIQLCQRAKAVIWVEPGAHAESRRLVEVREQLLKDFKVMAPCTHANRCEMLASSNERHWCHFFADPPKEILKDPIWNRFSREMRIDLRSLPYSYLVLQHRKVKQQEETKNQSGLTRIIGRPRVYKPVLKMFCCDESGLKDREAQKRDLPELYKICKKNEQTDLYQLTLKDERIAEATPAK
ncbi:MAG: small ribosomal subunit Rsm22 family protein [Limisphaerales bacterium]